MARGRAHRRRIDRRVARRSRRDYAAAVNIGGGMHHAMASRAPQALHLQRLRDCVDWLLGTATTGSPTSTSMPTTVGVARRSPTTRGVDGLAAPAPATLWPGTGWPLRSAPRPPPDRPPTSPLMPGSSTPLPVACIPRGRAVADRAVQTADHRQPVRGRHAADPQTDLALSVEGQRERRSSPCATSPTNTARGRWLAVGGGGYSVGQRHCPGSGPLDRRRARATSIPTRICDRWMGLGTGLGGPSPIPPTRSVSWVTAAPTGSTLGKSDAGVAPPPGIDERAFQQTDRTFLCHPPPF